MGCYWFGMIFLVILADISPIFTVFSGQFIVHFIHLSGILYAMLSIAVIEIGLDGTGQ